MESQTGSCSACGAGLGLGVVFCPNCGSFDDEKVKEDQQLHHEREKALKASKADTIQEKRKVDSESKSYFIMMMFATYWLLAVFWGFISGIRKLDLLILFEAGIHLFLVSFHLNNLESYRDGDRIIHLIFPLSGAIFSFLILGFENSLIFLPSVIYLPILLIYMLIEPNFGYPIK